jgi:hypothetical protein
LVWEMILPSTFRAATSRGPLELDRDYSIPRVTERNGAQVRLAA